MSEFRWMGTPEERAAAVEAAYQAIAPFSELPEQALRGLADFVVAPLPRGPKTVTTTRYGNVVWWEAGKYRFLEEGKKPERECDAFHELASRIVMTDDECRAILALSEVTR